VAESAQTPPRGRLPDFLHIGPGKAGSTWLHEVLSRHREAYLSGAKDLYFFSRYYDRGLAWYCAHFDGAGPAHAVVGEVSPDYLSHPAAPRRIRDSLGPDVRLMVTLRDPVTRAFSAHLYLAKHGLAGHTFRETLETVPEVLGEGRYATLLSRYLDVFDRDRLYIAEFDDLRRDPQSFLDHTTDWLGISRYPLPERLRAPVLVASKARWLPLAATSRRAADVVRRFDGADLVGRVKRAPVVQRALYRPLGTDRPTPSEADVNFIRRELEHEVEGAERTFDLALRERWGWL